MFKVENKNDKLITRMHTKLSNKTAEKYYWHHSGNLIANFEQNQHINQMFLLLGVSMFYVLEFS